MFNQDQLFYYRECRPWGHPQILADQLTLSQPGGTDYAHLITTGTPRFSDLPTALHPTQKFTSMNLLQMSCVITYRHSYF